MYSCIGFEWIKGELDLSLPLSGDCPNIRMTVKHVNRSAVHWVFQATHHYYAFAPGARTATVQFLLNSMSLFSSCTSVYTLFILVSQFSFSRNA